MAVNSLMLPLGTTAPDFSLPDPAGVGHSYPDIAGENGTLVVFACNHCPYVKRIGSVLGERAAEWTRADIGVVAINSNDFAAYPDDAPDKMSAQAREWSWNFPYLIDEDQSVAQSYGAACTPDFFLFDADRALAYRGRFDAATPKNDEPVTGAELDAAVRALLAGTVPDEQVPSIGCGIKWKPGNEPAGFSLL